MPGKELLPSTAVIGKPMIMIYDKSSAFLFRGFELLGPARRVCGANGTWSPQGIPFCGQLSSLLLFAIISTSHQTYFGIAHDKAA